MQTDLPISVSEAALPRRACSAVSFPPNVPALSIRQPWAWLIVNAGKNIENRCWYTKFRGRFLIHAAKGMTRDEYDDAFDFAFYRGGVTGRDVPKREVIERGGIIGEAEIVDCVHKSDSPWFMGEWGFVLRNVKPLPFVPCKGALGFFYPQNTTVRHARENDGGQGSGVEAGAKFRAAPER